MLEVLLLVVSLALADSVNSVTIAVALYLAGDDRFRSRVAGFAAGVFAVYALGGVVLVLGPGQLLDTVVSSSETRGFQIASIALGAASLIVAVVLFLRRNSTDLTVAVERLSPRSALALGASVTALDLPTAFPYFAAIATIAGSGLSTGHQLALLLTFNVIYVLPLTVILAARILAGQRSERLLRRSRTLIDRAAPALLVMMTAVTGGVLILRGVDGLLA